MIQYRVLCSARSQLAAARAPVSTIYIQKEKQRSWFTSFLTERRCHCNYDCTHGMTQLSLRLQSRLSHSHYTALYCLRAVMILWQSCTFVVCWSRFSLGSTQGSESQSRQVWTITTASCSLSLKIILNAVRWDKIFSIYPRSLETIVSQLKPVNRIQVSKHEVLKSSSSCLCETYVKYLYIE